MVHSRGTPKGARPEADGARDATGRRITPSFGIGTIGGLGILLVVVFIGCAIRQPQAEVTDSRPEPFATPADGAAPNESAAASTLPISPAARPPFALTPSSVEAPAVVPDSSDLAAASLVARSRVPPIPAARYLKVSTTEDLGNEECTDECSLRNAISSAGSGYAIDIPAGTYLLTKGGLLIDKDLTLIGAGMGKTIIQAALLSNDDTMSVLMIPAGGRVAIVAMTVRGGKAVWGGGIYNQGELTLTDIEVTGNLAEIHGGGIFNLTGGTLTMTGTTVSGNVARHGGGIFNDATITVDSSTLTRNYARFGKGGGLHNGEGGVAALTSSTVSGNTSRFGGGGIYSRSELSLTNTIVSDNSAGTDGGGVFNWSASLSITNSTVSHNNAVDDGGGIHNVQHGMMTLANSIIAMNVSRKASDCFTSAKDTKSLGHNLVSNDALCDFEVGEGDLVGTADNPVDPLLGILQDNGGPTLTRALLEGSPAIDAGDDGNAPSNDQRGVIRPQGAASDIGAFERGK